MTTIAIVPVDWWAMGADEYPYYRRCDLCDHTAVDDIWAGLHERDFRPLWQEVSDGSSGLVVCDQCMPGFLEGDP